MLTIQNLSYSHPGKLPLFDGINLNAAKSDKIALIGKNGTGKSTLLKLIAKQLMPFSGTISCDETPYYVPQHFGQYAEMTIAEALQVNSKLSALKEISEGIVTQENLDLLNDDWDIEERCSQALKFWGISEASLLEKVNTISGGELVKVFLAGIFIHKPGLVLLDEPSNHLDRPSRLKLYEWIATTKSTLLVVSHDRELLNLVSRVAEITPKGIINYGGNFADYQALKQREKETLNKEIQNKQGALRKAREKEREVNERQQKLDARGEGKKEKSGVARIMMNTLRNNAENSSAKLKGQHADKIGGIEQELRELKNGLPDLSKMKFWFDASTLHHGKLLLEAKEINFSYGRNGVWNQNLNFQIRSGERILLSGNNGAGKTTLLRILTGELTPNTGTMNRSVKRISYIDQDYFILDEGLTVYEQAQRCNQANQPEHYVRTQLARFLFPPDKSDKLCETLSGGERMRLALCCLTLYGEPIDIIILDEPTNNLDMENVEILTAALNEYRGTLIVVSHDAVFLNEINIVRTILLPME